MGGPFRVVGEWGKMGARLGSGWPRFGRWPLKRAEMALKTTISKMPVGG